MTPTLRNVIRLDSLPLNQTYYTPEGYLIDRPILTSTGIFEYLNPDGSVRRELRLPEDVFDPESLKSYKGRPIIITHDAGLVTKDNVADNQIGTILTEGYRSGDDVRAEIIIHDTDGMKKAGLKELSLGYNLDLDETPGEWNGQHYDAIQRNIRINHLALVREARAGEQARLNIDGRDPQNSLKGGKAMSNPKKTAHGDGVLSPEELAKAIEEYKARRDQRLASKADTEEKPAEEPVVETPAAQDGEEPAATEEPAVTTTDGDGEGEPAAEPTTEEKVQMVKDRRDRRDEAGDPENMEAAQGVIAQQDEDMGILFDIIDTLLANADFQKADAEPVTEEPAATEEPAQTAAEDGEGEGEGEGKEEPVIGAAVAEDCNNTDTEEPAAGTPVSAVNADSVDAIVRTRIQLGMVGRKLNLDGLEMMRIVDAKKAIINAVRPGLRLDGKSTAYINAAYDMAVGTIEAGTVKDTNYQKQQMFNKDGRNTAEPVEGSAAARQRMIDRRNKK